MLHFYLVFLPRCSRFYVRSLYLTLQKLEEGSKTEIMAYDHFIAEWTRRHLSTVLLTTTWWVFSVARQILQQPSCLLTRVGKRKLGTEGGISKHESPAGHAQFLLAFLYLTSTLSTVLRVNLVRMLAKNILQRKNKSDE